MKRILGALLLVGALACQARADADFTPAQRAQIVQIVRDALKSDPTILRDAVAAMQADTAAKEAAEARGLIAANRQALFHDPADAVAGNPAGDVTLVEFYDPRCPYCRKMLPAIDAMLSQDHALRLVYKDIPVLGAPSVMESRAIVAAQAQGGYFKMQQALMKTPATPDEAMIRDAAKSLGLDADRLVHDMNSEAVTRRLQGNLDLARTLKVDGTPVFVVGEQFIQGAVDPAQLEAAVAGARKHAAR